MGMRIAISKRDEKVKGWIQDILVSFLASVLIALFAPISIKLPFLLVPFTVQNNMVLLFAALMGSRRGTLSVAFYLGQGIMGYPVFAAGKSGLAHLLGPTGGYLVGYLVAAYVVGILVEHAREKTPLKMFQIMGLGFLIIYFLGAAHLCNFIGWKSAILSGVLPFIIPDAIKIIFFSRFSLKNLRAIDDTP